jgi:hypothetical protein
MRSGRAGVGQKELRILDVLEPIVGSHRLVVDRRVIEEDAPLLQNEKTKAYSFVYQFTRMWRERGALAHEDRLEAVAMACEYFSEKMGVDQKKGEERRKQALLDKELREYNNHMLGIQDSPRLRWRSIGRLK